jgi:hypothetical protein
MPPTFIHFESDFVPKPTNPRKNGERVEMIPVILVFSQFNPPSVLAIHDRLCT